MEPDVVRFTVGESPYNTDDGRPRPGTVDILRVDGTAERLHTFGDVSDEGLATFVGFVWAR